jgi:hypothetical protein
MLLSHGHRTPLSLLALQPFAQYPHGGIALWIWLGQSLGNLLFQPDFV